ncbi:MAG: hypothetical protein ACFCBU_08305 [Cyanophyceae cyanobacterium]
MAFISGLKALKKSFATIEPFAIALRSQTLSTFISASIDYAAIALALVYSQAIACTFRTKLGQGATGISP